MRSLVAGYSCSMHPACVTYRRPKLAYGSQWSLNWYDIARLFDMVPQCQLLKKLKFYHIENQFIFWIEKWLTVCKQWISLDGKLSGFVPVYLEYLRVVYWACWCFWSIANNITENISSQLQMTAQLLYRAMRIVQDSILLHKGSACFVPVGSCLSLTLCKRSQNPIITNYYL